MSWFRPVGYVALLIAGVLTLYLAARMFGGDDKPAEPTAAETTEEEEEEPAELGDEAPDSVRTNEAAAKQHIERQHCLAGCKGEHKICVATADGADAKQRCNDQKQSCDDGCP